MHNLYNTGARNFFFVNLPPLDRTPMNTNITAFGNRTSAVEANFADGVALFNSLLPQYVSRFQSIHNGTRTAVYDAHGLFNMILDDPHAYGFKDNASMNCTGCFWANNYHPMSVVHERIANDMLPDLSTVGWPPLVLT